LNDRFPLTRLVAASFGHASKDRDKIDPLEGASDLAWAREVLAAVEDNSIDGRPSLALPVRIEIAIAEAESEADAASPAQACDTLFRLVIQRWAMEEGDLAELFPVRDAPLRLVEFDYNVSGYLGARSTGEFPAALSPGPSYIVAFGCTDGGRREPLLVDARTACILMLSDGSRTAGEIASELDYQNNHATMAGNLKRIESLFVAGLIGLHDKRVGPAIEDLKSARRSPSATTAI